MRISQNSFHPKQYFFMALAALLILAVSVALWYFPKEYAYRLQHPQNLNPVGGAWDLTRFDLASEIIFLEGTVEYVTDALLTPEEFEAYEGEVHYGRVTSDTKVATARLRLIFPEDQIYSLASGSVAYNERVYVNGQWSHDVGTPGLTKEESAAGQNFNRFDVIPQNGVVEIVRQGSNFAHKEGSGFAGYWVGSPANIKQMVAVNQMFTSINIGLYLCLFLLHMMIFLIIRGYRPNLWFSLLCLMWLVRAGFTGRFVYWSMFPDIPWEPVYKLGCASVALTGVLLLMMARDQFSGIVQKWPLRILAGLQAAFALSYFFLDTVTVSRVKVGSEVLLYMTAAYLAARFLIVLPKQLRQRKLLPEQMITLVGLVTALFTMLHDAMRYNNIMPGLFHYEIGDVGLLILVLFQMVAMVLGTMRQLHDARQTALVAWETAESARKSEQLALLRAKNAEKDLALRTQLVAGIPEDSLVTCGSLTLDLSAGRAYLGNDDLQLVPKELSILHFFIRHKDELLSRETIYEGVWKQTWTEKDTTLKSNISRLRRKIDGSGFTISSVRGKGYRFEEA